MRLFGVRSAMMTATILCLSIGTSTTVTAESEAPDVTAANAIVVDATTGDILYDKSAGQPVPVASLTKLFTALVAIESTPLDRPMTTSASDLVGEASMGLAPGEQLPFETLLYGMLLSSGNDAATAIARNLGAQPGDTDAQAVVRFMDRVNMRAQELGLTGTRLANPHGLDQDGHYSTARDIAALTMYALEHEPAFAAAIGAQTYDRHGHALHQTNALLGSYEGLLGGKTGVTDRAGFGLMEVAERDGRRIIAVLLGSTPDAWYGDATTLLDYGFHAAAIPGFAPGLGKISFAPVPSVATPAPAPATGEVLVTASQSGTAVVSIPEIANAPRRSPWMWIVAGILVAPTALLGLHQTQRLLVLLAIRRQRASGYAWTVPGATASAPATRWETQPFGAVNSQTVSRAQEPFAFGDTMQWSAPATRRQDRPATMLRPAFAPSIGD